MAPYSLGSEKEGGEVVFSFDADADMDVGNGAGAGAGVGAEKELYYGFWTMLSLIPEDGRWVICKCTDTGKIIMDERGRPIWRLVEHSLFQKSCPVYN